MKLTALQQAEMDYRSARSDYQAGSISIRGIQGDYRLQVTPKLKKHRGVLRQQSVRAATLAELDAKLDHAIRVVREAGLG